MLSLHHLESKLGFRVLLDLQSIEVVGGEGLTCLPDVVVDLLAEVLVHLLLEFVVSHVLVADFLFYVEIVGHSSFVDVGFQRGLDCVSDASDEGLVHHVLVSKVRHLVAGGSVDVATELALLCFLSFLSRLNPVLVLLELSRALLSFPVELVSLRAVLQVLFAFVDGAEDVSYVIFTVDHHRLSRLGNLWISVVKPSLHGLTVFALSLMLN